jgi:hypothetical protein
MSVPGGSPVSLGIAYLCLSYDEAGRRCQARRGRGLLIAEYGHRIDPAPHVAWGGCDRSGQGAQHDGYSSREGCSCLAGPWHQLERGESVLHSIYKVRDLSAPTQRLLQSRY